MQLDIGKFWEAVVITFGVFIGIGWIVILFWMYETKIKPKFTAPWVLAYFVWLFLGLVVVVYAWLSL